MNQIILGTVFYCSADGEASSSTPQLNFQPPDGVDLSKSFAQLSLPGQFCLQPGEEPSPSSSGTPPAPSSDGCGLQNLRVVVRAESGVAARTQFGPLQGEPILERDVPEDFHMKDLWQVFAEDGRRLYVSTVNPEKSNWVRYLRPAPSRKQRNVAAVVKDDLLYFVTTRDLRKGEEVLYWIDDPDLMWTKKRAEKKSIPT